MSSFSSGRCAMAVAVVLVAGLTARVASATGLGFRRADFTILSADGASVIGAVHFDVDDSRPGTEVVTSTARYNDGQYDVERDDFDIRNALELPVMSAYAHGFFHPDHTPFLDSAVNFVTGAAKCTSYEGNQPVVQSKTMVFPPDSYAGAAMMLPLQKSLRAGADGPIVMYDFACMPDPRLVKVEAYAQTPAPWNHYPGELVRANIKPDFGWLDYLIAPFVPEMHAWFSPSDDFHFVGAEFSRFYKGPQVILARRAIDQHADDAAPSNP
jgi:hypothetical protein